MPSTHPSISLPAPAKINLALAVAPPRSDGYHPISSWFAPISICDELTIDRLPEQSPGEHIITWAPHALRPSPIDWPIEKDLAVRAHRLLEEEAHRPLPIRLSLAKRIPVGAGLGGGSSDAAAALLAIRELFQLPISDDRLRELGLRLGADVPFFLPPDAAQPAIVEGVGERIQRTAPIRSDSGGDVAILLIAPDFGCPTGAVYRAFDAAPSPRFRTDDIHSMARRGVVDPEALFNDLAAPAMTVAPALREVVEAVSRITGRSAHVTGSGSGVFVPFDPADSACAAFIPAAAAAIVATLPAAAVAGVRLSRPEGP